jgi:hypothetical protein
MAGLPDFSWSKHTKAGKMTTNFTNRPQPLPNGQKLYQMAVKYSKWPQNIPNGRKIFQMAIKYANNFHSKALQN